MASTKDGEQAKICTALTLAVRTPYLDVWLEQVHAIAKACGREARWQEGCFCHQHLLANTQASARKASMEAAGCVGGVCPWQGRRLVENMCAGPARATDNIMAATPPPPSPSPQD